VANLYDRDAKILVDVLSRMADMFDPTTNDDETYRKLWEWRPEGALGKPFDREFRTAQARALRSIIEAIAEQQET
jgi:hypothetical protein